MLPSLNDCSFCNKLKCKYCKNYSVNCNMCKKDRCFNCARFNKLKDILINSNNKIISDFIKKFLYDFFSISDFSISFFNLKNIINVQVFNWSLKNITDTQVFNESLKSNDILKKEKVYCKSKKFGHYCKI